MTTVKACVLRIEGTNCEEESARAFRMAGADPEIVHLKTLMKKNNLADYDILMLPGGFSSGDYVRAGAIFASRIKASLKEELDTFVSSGKPVLGICNGFQILVELGILPGFSENGEGPQAVLATNDSGRFECRPSLLEHVEENRCIFTKKFPQENVVIPVAHAEGKFLFPKDEEREMLDRLMDRRQVVFRYVGPEGQREYPWNPNGSLHDIAGICNREGNVLGMMPHPERVIDQFTVPDWTRNGHRPAGLDIFKNAVEHAKE